MPSTAPASDFSSPTWRSSAATRPESSPPGATCSTKTSPAGAGCGGIGEPVWAGRSAAELEECRRHESLLNLAFADAPEFSLMCPYDSAALTDEDLAAARHSHPLISRADGTIESDRFEPALPDPFEGELEPPPVDAAAVGFTIQQLSEVRQFAAERAQAIGPRLRPHRRLRARRQRAGGE